MGLGLRWNVQNGLIINVWRDSWVPNLANFRIHSLPPEDSSILRVEDLIQGGCRWNSQLLRQLFTQQEVIAKEAILISCSNTADQVVWYNTEEG